MAADVSDRHPFIITLQFDADTFARVSTLRRAHFPAALDRVPAHLTLFHQLPGTEGARVVEALNSAAVRPPIELRFEGVRFLGRGVALQAASPDLLALRAALAGDFAPWLTRQDQQKFQPHVTIQNKAAPDVARTLHARLSGTFAPWSGVGTGLLIWRYLGGPWALEAEIPFRDERFRPA